MLCCDVYVAVNMGLSMDTSITLPDVSIVVDNLVGTSTVLPIHDATWAISNAGRTDTQTHTTQHTHKARKAYTKHTLSTH